MIDIKLIRENPQAVKQLIIDKRSKNTNVDHILKLDAQRRDLQAQIDTLKSDQKKAGNTPEWITLAKEIKVKIQTLQEQYDAIEPELTPLLKALPNWYSDDTPIGKDDSENKIIKQRGQPRQFSFTPKDQEELLTTLGCLDRERAVKIAGARFVYLLGDVVMLQQAIISWTYATLTNQSVIQKIIADWGLSVSDKAFTLALPPIIMKREMMDRMGRYNPNDTTYELKLDDMVLIASAEHSLGPIYADEIIPASELPIRYLGFSPAFRREAGTYGKDSRGTFRLHQFDKLEMETFTTPEQGMNEHLFLVAVQEYLTQQLGLPYQLIIACTGDMGHPDFRHVDVETWIPSQNTYRETHSADFMTDFQARRLNTRVKLDSGNEFVSMNDATAFAMSRTLVAICENYQQEDGSIQIPEVLRSYMGAKEFIGK
jgi:seryl-tRNA synthetase